jgi:hypothetical protein
VQKVHFSRLANKRASRLAVNQDIIKISRHKFTNEWRTSYLVVTTSQINLGENCRTT